MSRQTQGIEDSKDAVVNEMSDRISTIRDELSAMASNVYEEGRSRGKAALRAAGRDAGRMMERGGEVAGRVRAQASDVALRTEDLVRARPAAALGIALGVGLLIGLMSRRR